MRRLKRWSKALDTNMDGCSVKRKYLRNILLKNENSFYFLFSKENSEDLYNDIFTSRMMNLENALHSVKFS